MGNIGRSSTGCHLCRKRKIKCDEGKPGCRRCGQIRKTCPGYPFSIELSVRHQTPPPVETTVPLSATYQPAEHTGKCSKSLHLSGEATSTLDSTTKPRTKTLIKLENHSREPSSSVGRQYETPLAPPKYDIQHQSTCFFLNLFCFQACQMYNLPALDYLPAMLEETGHDSCLHQATKAVSRMTLADRYSGGDIRLQTGREYVKALSMIKASIAAKPEAVKDETVVAVWLLGLYEAINSVLSHGRCSREARSTQDEWQSHVSHIRGALRLLHMRGKNQFTTPRGEKIFRIFKAAIHMRLFILNSVTSTDFDDLERDVYQDGFEFLPSSTAAKATDYFHKAARLLEKIKDALRLRKNFPSADDIAEKLRLLVKQGEDLDASMNGWSKDETGWDMMKIKTPTQGTMWSLYPSHAIYFFYSVWVYLYWVRYIIARIKLYGGLLIVVTYEKEQFDTTSAMKDDMSGRKLSTTTELDFKMSQYRTIVQLMIGELIGLTAYALGDVNNRGEFQSSKLDPKDGAQGGFREINVTAAMQLVIPLKVLQRSSIPTPTQKGAIDLALTQIGDGFRRQPIHT